MKKSTAALNFRGNFVNASRDVKNDETAVQNPDTVASVEAPAAIVEPGQYGYRLLVFF